MLFLKINNINEIEKLKNNLLIKDKLFYQISNVECENFKSHFKEIENEILTHYCSEHKTLDLKSGWLSSHTTTEPLHNHILLAGNHVMIQVLDVGNMSEELTILDENGIEVSVDMNVGDVIIFHKSTMHGLKTAPKKLRILALSINI